MVYMYALAREPEQYEGTRTAGEIHYPNRIQRVPSAGVDQALSNARNGRPPNCRSGSAQLDSSAIECHFCDITATACPERIQ